MVEKFSKNGNEMYKITCNGKSVNTKHYQEIPDNDYNEIINDYNSKPEINDVKKELREILKNNGQMKCNVNKHFLQDVHDEVVIKGCRWSIKEVFNNREILSIFYHKIQDNKKVFGDDMGTYQKIVKSIDLGGSAICRKATYYPLDSVREMVNRYCKKGGNYYDYSCGWGDRLLGAMSCGVNYYGTDPNYRLTEKLEEINKMAREVTNIDTDVKIYTQGSEVFIPELEGKIDFSFSSPPYFDLEDYKIGDQSFKEGTSYDSWLNNYMRPTMENIYKYLKDDGYFAINIKNSSEHPLMDDCVKIAQEVGFKFLRYDELNVIGRTKNDGSCIENVELIGIFSKGKALPKEEIKVELW